MITVSPANKETVRGIDSLALLCELAAELGRSPEALLAAAGVSPGALSDPAGTVTARAELAAIDALLEGPEEASGLGLIDGTRYRLTTYGIWSYALLSSRTLADALDIGIRHIGLTYACTTITAAETGGRLELRFADWPLPEAERRFVLARDTVAALGIMRGVLDREVRPLEVRLALPAPADPDAFRSAFGREVEFEAEDSALVFDRSLLDLEMPQASELTARMCLEQCRGLLEARHALSGLPGQVRDLLLRDPQRMPGQEEVAAALHLSVRSLRRRLREEDTGFRELLEQTRRGLAEDLLLTEGLTVDQVASRIGYADTPAFVNAFRRWTGTSPRRWVSRTISTKE